jgi:glucose/mannose transport system substrate-binding protein
MKALATALALLAGVHLFTGCSGGDASEQATETRLELLTWWREPGELAAFDALLAVHEAAHPGAQVIVQFSAARTTMVDDLQTRLADGNPPTAFQETLGGRVRAWAASAQPLDSYASGWSGDYDPTLLDLVSSDGALIGVPLAITRQNNAYYNKRVLDALQLGIPYGSSGFSFWLEELREAGYLHPLCIGDRDNWLSAQILFEDVVPAVAGAEFSREYWSGLRSGGDDALLLDALEYASKLVDRFNTDLAELDMPPGVLRLMEEREPATQCVMTPMSDGAGAILDDHYVANEDFVQTAWPGTEELFVLGGDAFIMVRGVESPDSAYALFATMASREGQIAFSTAKGSMPARLVDTADLGLFGPLPQSNMLDLASGTTLPAFQVLGTSGRWYRGTLSAGFPWEGLYDVTHDFFLTGDSGPVVAYLRQNYDRLVQ